MIDTKVNSCFVGIDVSKDKLDIYIRPTQQSWTQKNGDYDQLCNRLDEVKPQLIVLEPTGGYELGVYNALKQRGFRVSREHAYKIHHHAKGSGQLAKTDRLDASVIAHYAQCYSEQIDTQSKSEYNALLSQLVSRRGQLIKMRVAEKNRLEKKGFCEEIKLSCIKIIEILGKEIGEIDNKIKAIIDSNEGLKQKYTILNSAIGIGERTSTVLLAKLPELGKVSRKKISALVGLAPFQNQSGKFRGQQSIRGGRFEVRAALYLSVLSSIRYNPIIKSFYEKLLEKGKKKKVAITACAHKLLRILNAMIAKKQDFIVVNKT